MLVGGNGVPEVALECGVLDDECTKAAGPRDCGHPNLRRAQNSPDLRVVPRGDPLKDRVFDVSDNPGGRHGLCFLPVNTMEVVDGVPPQELHVAEGVLSGEGVANLELVLHNGAHAVVLTGLRKRITRGEGPRVAVHVGVEVRRVQEPV